MEISLLEKIHYLKFCISRESLYAETAKTEKIRADHLRNAEILTQIVEQLTEGEA